MKNKNIVILIYLVLLIIFISVILFVLNLNKNKNKKYFVTHTINVIQPPVVVNKAINLKSYESVDNIKLCNYDKDCIKGIFLNCTKGLGMFVTSTGSNALNVSGFTKTNDCYFYIVSLKDGKSGVSCNFKKDKLNESIFDTFINNNNYINILVQKYGCKLENS